MARRQHYLLILAAWAATLLAACNLDQGNSSPGSDLDLAATRQALTPLGEALKVRLNRDRDVLGLPALVPSQALDQAAGLRAEDMLVRDYLGPVGPGDPSVAAQDLMSAAGYSGQLGELIYEHDGPLSELTETTMGTWMASDAHRDVLLNTRFQYMGAGLVGDGAGRWIVVLLFAEVGP